MSAKNPRLPITFADDEREVLAAVSAKTGASMSEIVRRATRDFLSKLPEGKAIAGRDLAAKFASEGKSK